MNLLVCISKTPDTTSKIAFDDSGKKLLEDGVQFILNPYDEWYALVRAIELKEQFGGQVDVIHVGEASSEMIIRKALAIGADAAFRVDMIPAGSWDTASQIAAFAKTRNYDLILLGKETIDYNGSEVGSMLAGILDLPYIAYATKLTIDGQIATLESEIEGGIALSEVHIPMVLSCAKGIAEQRIPNMMGIMNAKKKPLEVVSPTDVHQHIILERFELPPAKSSVTMIAPDDIDKLVDIFHSDLKII
ncbi:MAG: electron transfer flavoprotein subunit beta/FixA family protein [Saprospiraceae bacterium]